MVLFLIGKINVAVHEKRNITFVRCSLAVVIIFIFLVHLRIRSRKRWIDILRRGLTLGSLQLLDVRKVGLLEGPIFVKCTADEVSAVWQVLGAMSITLDNLRLALLLTLRLFWQTVGIAG